MPSYFKTFMDWHLEPVFQKNQTAKIFPSSPTAEQYRHI